MGGGGGLEIEKGLIFVKVASIFRVSSLDFLDWWKWEVGFDF